MPPPTPPPLAAPLSLLLAGLLLMGCRAVETEEPAPGPGIDLVGTWEVLDEPDVPLTRHGQRYTFTADSTVRIFRPRSLGPVSTLQAAYGFSGDTLIIRSEFDAEMLLPSLAGDTLTLDPVGGSRPMMLVRTDNAVPAAPPPTAPASGPDSVYSPPGDLPPEELRTVPNP